MSRAALTAALAATALLAGCGNDSATAPDGAFEMPIVYPIDGAPGRQAFWTVELGGDDSEDIYTLAPPPAEGDTLAFMAASEDDPHAALRVELVRASDGWTVAEISLTDERPFASWQADGPAYLRVTRPAGAAPVEALIGVRILEAGSEAAATGAPREPVLPDELPVSDDEDSPVPDLIAIPAD
jgi:hypothetical protein